MVCTKFDSERRLIELLVNAASMDNEHIVAILIEKNDINVDSYNKVGV